MTETREAVMASPSVHLLTKEVLQAAASRDVVDAYYDVMLAARVLKAEMDKVLGREGR